MYSTEKIAILLATYNAGEYINEQLDSLLSQTYQDFVIYIHDDGSSDNTKNVIEQYADKNMDKIIIIDGEPTKAAKNNFFFLMTQVEAPFYMFCDQDDVWLENKVSLTYTKMKELVQNGEKDVPILISTDLKVVNEKLEIMSESMRDYSKIQMSESITMNKLMIQNYAVGCTTMINRKLRDISLGSFNENIVMHDWWLAMIAQAMGKYENIEQPTILYRQHGNNCAGADNVNLSYALRMINKLNEKSSIIRETRRQVKAFCEKFNYNDKIMRKYGDLDKKNKLYRIYFHIRYGINKQGILRKIGILICC